MFGEVALLAETPRSATATAVEPTTIRIIQRETVETELDKLSPWVGAMLSALSLRFLERSEKIVELESHQL